MDSSPRATSQRFPQERQRRMAKLVSERGALTIADLGAHFGISDPTIRRDLAVLEQAGLVARTHGGVTLPGAGEIEPSFLEKLRLHQAAKGRIARAAAREAAPGQTIVLDSGTTILALARALAGKPVTIVTMDIKVAEAAAVGATEVHLLGGRIRNGYYSLVGSWSLDRLAAMRCDVFFMAADAIDEAGVSNSTEEEAQVKRAAIEAASRTILLADHSKLGRRSFVPVCDLAAIGTLVTDRPAEPLLASYRTRLAAIQTV